MQSMLQIGRMWLSNNQQFMTRDVTLTINKAEGPTALKITPADMQGDIDLTIDEASMEPLSQQDKLTHAQAFINQLTAAQNQSIVQNKAVGTPPMAVDFNKVAAYLAQQYNLQGFSKILIPQGELNQIHQRMMAEASQHMAAAQANAPAKPQAQSLMEQLKITMEKLPEDVQNELIFQIFGIRAQEQSPGEKQLLLKGVDTITRAASAGHDMQMGNLNIAHDVVKNAQDKTMDVANMAQQAAQQPAQPAATPTQNEE